ncbi:MAG: D-amino acid dehydrogenase [Beijerinckiaceae bacterium]|nr:D-amino acid dehydrogenase [Beijerinckiaceae bacterium]
MKICVLGAGVVGLTTAWWLAERGYEVALVDRRSKPGQETSFANGAQLSYKFVAPFASPETLAKLPALLFSNAAPIRLRPGLDGEFLRWGLDFVRLCNAAAVKHTIVAQLALAALSRAEMQSLLKRSDLPFAVKTAGKLILYRSQASFAAARRHMALETGGDTAQVILSPKDCLSLEPALKIKASELSGGTYDGEEQVADCASFCDALAAQLRRRNTVTFHMNTDIHGPIVENGAVRGVETSGGPIEADLLVLSMASQSVAFARRLGLRLPIYPLKGYSITAAPADGAVPLQHSVTDFDSKIVFAPLERDGAPAIRAAGIADMVGNDAAIDAARIAVISRLTATTLDIDETRDLQPWAGLRPATPDSRPLIGWSPVKGLFLNTGHGGLGWTLACGSARLAADMISGETPPVEPGWFALERRA